jgi:hypothetical protein
VEWESRVVDYSVGGRNCFKADDSLKSFVFTLKNPHNIPARRFTLKAEKKQHAIFCPSEQGPCFGYNVCDIWVDDNCNSQVSCDTSLGNSYTNDTGVDGMQFFTGWYSFQVKEIEVFETCESVKRQKRERDNSN